MAMEGHLAFHWTCSYCNTNQPDFQKQNITRKKLKQHALMESKICQWFSVVGLTLMVVFVFGVRAWTGEIRGRVVCDVCGDSSVGPEDHLLQGAEVAVLCITKSGEVLNYQAFTDAKGIYTVAETMPESNRWDSCLARPISSFHEHCSHLGEGSSGLKFKYSHPSGYHHAVRPFVYRHNNAPAYCF